MRVPLRIGLSTAIVVASAAIVGEARAQPKAPPPPSGSGSGSGRDRSNSQFTLRREEAGGTGAQTARARARAGDCAGALMEFDEAIKSSIDPTLRRDRGICHDKLGNVFPAIDDFRAYLTARPDAPDSEAIRQRLSALEGQTEHETRAGAPSAGGASSEEASASVTVGSKGVYAESGSGSASAEGESVGPKRGEQAHPFDYYVEQEKINDAAKKSPLRYGSGVVLGPYMTLPRFYFGSGARTDDFGYGAGLALRYSTGRTLTLVSEIGFSGYGKTGEVTSQTGPEVMGGIELRLPLSRVAADHLLLRGGVGYERNIVSGTRATLDELLGRFAFGYRHTFGTSIALEGLVDGGPALVFPEGSDSTVVGFVGLSVALVVGF